jgi:hypothetical protein
VLYVRQTLAEIALSLIASAASAENPAPRPTIKVTFSIDGTSVPCDDLKVELRIGKLTVPVESVDHGFVVPPIFAKLYTSPKSRRKNNVAIDLGCGDYNFEFPGEYPVRLQPGVWKLGVAYPPFRNNEVGGTSLFERGTWISYVVWECNECEPVTVSMISHFDSPASVVEGFRREQEGASGERARDIAYALAVFNVEYEHNRDYLMKLLHTCLSGPESSPGDDLCDSRLGDYLINLYWRGDSELLLPLLRVADSQSEAIEDDGYFLADLLDRRAPEALRALQGLSIEEQQYVCREAGTDEFSIDSPKLERVAKFLRAEGGDVALRCLQAVQTAADGRSQRMQGK